MAEEKKKYLVRVPAGKETNDFQFDELIPAFQKYCSKLTQNQGTRIASYYTKLEVPKDMSWAELLNDVTAMYSDCLRQIEAINEIPTDEAGKYILSRQTYDDFRALSGLMSSVGPVVWNRWDELSKIYWKSCIPRIRMLLEECTLAKEG